MKKTTLVGIALLAVSLTPVWAESDIVTSWSLALNAKYQRERTTTVGTVTTRTYSVGLTRVGLKEVITALSPLFESPIPATAKLISYSDGSFYFVSGTNAWDVSENMWVDTSVSVRTGSIAQNTATGRVGINADTQVTSVTLVIDAHPEVSELNSESFYIVARGLSTDTFTGVLRPDGILTGAGSNTVNLQGFFYDGPNDLEHLVNGSALGYEKAVNY